MTEQQRVPDLGPEADAVAGVVDRPAAAAALSWLLAAIGIVVLDVRVGRVDLLSDPAGFVVAFVGVLRLHRATTTTPWMLALVVLAPVAVGTSALVEVGGVLYGEASGITASAQVPVGAPGWIATAALWTAAMSSVGVLLLARHLRRVLRGIASDRWRQVTFAWLAFVAAGIAGLATGSIELIVLAAAAGLTAAALLLLSILATRRLLEDDGPQGHP